MELTSLALPANEMVWDPTRELLLVGAAIRVGDPGSVIRAIDPTSLATEFEVPVGGDPEHLALSDDGRSLWVTIGGDFRQYLVRVDLDSRTVATETPLPLTTFGSPLEAQDLVVLPGSSSVVVSMALDFTDGRLVVYEDAVLRAELDDLHDDPVDSLMAVDSTTVIGFSFGYLTAYRLKGTEIAATRTTDYSLPDGQVTYESERIFGDQGWVVDANTFDELDSVGVMGTCVAEDGGERVYYLEWNGERTLDLVVTDPSERVRVSGQPLGTPAGLRTTSLVRWGDRGLAFLGTTATSREAVMDTVFVVTSEAVGAPP